MILSRGTMRHIQSLMVFAFATACSDGGKQSPIAGTGNTNPRVEINEPSYGAAYPLLSEIQFIASVSDTESNNTELTVTWTSDIDGDLYSSTADDDGDSIFETEDLSTGAHNITAQVRDPDGGEASASILLNMIEEGEPPSIAILTPDNDEFAVEDEPLTLSAVVDDEDDDLQDLLITFSIVVDDEPIASCSDEPDEEGVGVCSVTLDAGTVDIIAEVTDPLGQTDTDYVTDFEIKPAEEHDGDGDGYAEIDGDCDDDNSAIHPAAPEVVDGIDNNCNDLIDEDSDTTDDDGDGFTELEGDCDDTVDSVFPGAVEYVNGIDEDCDGDIDDGTIAYDDDGDCYCEGSDEITTCEGSIAETCGEEELDVGDCDDADEDLHPGAIEICDEVDNDCNDLIDADDPGTDDDRDGYSACDGEDCDDSSSRVHPGAIEECNDIDDDCNGIVDDDDAFDARVWYHDADDDGYGSPTDSRTSCEPPPDYLTDSTDCDDGDDSIHPGATEVCDPLDTDEDCDGSADGADASGKTLWFRDSDGDGYGISSSYLYACDEPSGYVDNNEDCDDTDDDSYPFATEVCDGIDNDCDSRVDIDAIGCDRFYLDEDGDGQGSAEFLCLCEAGDVAHYDALDSTDCCDSDADAYEGSTHTDTNPTACGNYDYDCDGWESYRWAEIGECGSGLGTELCFGEPEGWRGSTYPYCGVERDWLYDCSLECDYPWDCWCEADYTSRIQECG
jgi:hypothetical protein